MEKNLFNFNKNNSSNASGSQVGQITCEPCANECKKIEIKIGRYGLYAQIGEERVTIDETVIPSEITLEDIEKMAEQTAEIVNVFDKLSIESENKIPLPHEVRQWAVSTIFDCADRWEIRFADVFDRLLESLGKNLLKESIRVQQVRDIFGTRAIEQIKNELGLS